MKILSDLYKKIRETAYYRGQFSDQNDKQKILFLDPIMTDFDWYTCLIPYFAIPENENVDTALTGLYRYSELDRKPQTVLSALEIKWANYIVVPFTLEKFYGPGELFDSIKKVNPEIKIIFTVEFDFYEIRPDHYLLLDNPDKKDEIIERIEGNCRAADRLIVMNDKLNDKLIGKGFQDVKTMAVLYAGDVLKENVDFKNTLGNKHTANMFFLSIDLNDYNASNFKDYIPVLEEIQAKHKKNFRLIMLGDDPKKHFPKIKLEYTYLKKGSIIHKYKAIVQSNADCHLVLNKKTDYHINSEIYADYIDRGLFSIPIISMNAYPYNELISNGENGFLINARKDLAKIVSENIADKAKLGEICTNIKEDLEKYYEIDGDKLKYIENLFVDGYADLEEME
jgi:hypothetical protein